MLVAAVFSGVLTDAWSAATDGATSVKLTVKLVVDTEPSAFVRVMVLPRSLLGKSSFQFVNEEDKAKPRVQQYKIFTDIPIATP